MSWIVSVINLYENNLGASFENIITLVYVLGSLLFFVRDFKVGLSVLMLFSLGVFIWFYQLGLSWILPLTIFFIGLIFLSFTLYFTAKADEKGGLV